MLERLHNVDWSALTHAYGPAADVPELIRALAGADRQARKDAYWELYGNIFHQGTRYPATAPAVPFLLELLADPATPDRHELLLLLTHLVCGQFGVAADPTLYAGEPDGAAHDADDYGTILRDVYRAAEAGLPIYLSLATHADTAHLRAAAVFMLACLWTRAAVVVPVLRARVADEASAVTRATLAFALGRLQCAGTTDPILALLHERDPAPLVRLLAAVGLVRAGSGPAPEAGSGPAAEAGSRPAAEAAVATLIAAVQDPDSTPGYDQLPCGERDLAGDIGHVLRTVPRALGLRALPALCRALERAEDFGTVGLVEAMLTFSFGERHDLGDDLRHADEADPEDMSQMPAPEPIDPARLTPEQREVLTAMARSHELWTVGNLFYVLRSHGIPTERFELCALLGLEMVRDEAAELASQARFHRIHMHDPAEAASLLRRAAALAPGDAALWQQLAHTLLAADDPNEALIAVDRALMIDPTLAAAHFERGLIVVNIDPGAAAEAFARAAELGHQPLQSSTNHATCLAMIGRREQALQILGRLTAEHPEFAEGWYSLGLAQLKVGRLRAAVTTLGRAIELAPDHGNAHYARACAHALAGDPGPALADVARAVAIEPDLRAAIRDDADFAAIADTPEFIGLTAGDAAVDDIDNIHGMDGNLRN